MTFKVGECYYREQAAKFPAGTVFTYGNVTFEVLGPADRPLWAAYRTTDGRPHRYRLEDFSRETVLMKIVSLPPEYRGRKVIPRERLAAAGARLALELGLVERGEGTK